MKKTPLSLAVALLLITIAGVAVRWIGLARHVTTIDEMIVLAEGRWNVAGREDQLGSSGPIEFARKIAESPESSYAPLQFALTYFLVGDDPLTPEGLYRSRIVSAAIGSLSLPLFLLCVWRSCRKRVGLALLTPLTYFCFSLMQIINTQQNHSYIAGVTFAMLSILCFDQARAHSGISARTLWLTIPGLFPLINYQLMLVNAALGTVLITTWIAEWWNRDKSPRGLISIGVPPILLGILTLTAAVALARLKSDLSVTWWVSHFGFQGNFVHAVLSLPRKFFDIFHAVLMVSRMHELNNLSAALMGSCLVAGIPTLWIRRVDRAPQTLFYLHSAFAILGVFTALFFLKRIPLSPSRHMLILTPVLLLAMFHVLRELEIRMEGQRFSRFIRISYILLPLVVAAAFFAQYPRFIRESREMLNPEIVRRVARDTGTRTIVTGHWDYNKVYCLLNEEVRDGMFDILSIKDQSQFPREHFLLIGHYPEVFRSIYEMRSDTPYQSDLIVHDVREYDIEPSPYVRYWENRLFIWHVRPVD